MAPHGHVLCLFAFLFPPSALVYIKVTQLQGKALSTSWIYTVEINPLLHLQWLEKDFRFSHLKSFMGPFYSIDKQGDVMMRIRIQPRASVDRVDGVVGDALKLRITAPPIAGKANDYLLRFLAKALALRPSQLTLEFGQSSRNKRLRIHGLTPESRATLLNWCRQWTLPT